MEIIFSENFEGTYDFVAVDGQLSVIAGCCSSVSVDVYGLDCLGTVTHVDYNNTLKEFTISNYKGEDPTHITFDIEICSNFNDSGLSYIEFVCGGSVIATLYISDIAQVVASPVTSDISTLDFGIVIKNNTLTLPIILTNNSTEDIDLHAALSGSCSGVSMGTNDFTLIAGGTYDFDVIFAPVTAGVNLNCTVVFNIDGEECVVLEVDLTGFSLDDCTLAAPLVVNRSDCYEGGKGEYVWGGDDSNSPFTALHQAFADFYACNDVDLVAMSNKLKSSGFFGIFDKSKKTANDINDIHYLAMFLYAMWVEKFEDALANCECCRYSKHPKYYIDSYNLQCLFEYFRCKNIDISCWLKAFQVDKVMFLYRYTKTEDEASLFGWELGFGHAEQFTGTYDPDIERQEDTCDSIDGDDTYSSDWIYEHLKNYVSCPVEEEDCLPYTANEIEEQEFYTGSINEIFNCELTYTRNLNEPNCD